MSDKSSHSPRQYVGVMVSSTFKDLEDHRTALMDALRKEELFAIGMEDYVPVPGEDVIDSSLNMVRKGGAYIGLISHRCGQILDCATRNSKSYSVTRLEFEEAMKLGLPTLIFVMSDEHAVKPAHIDRDADNVVRLQEFKKAAKAGRIYIEFDSLDDFKPKAIHAVASLRRYIEEHSKLIHPALSPVPSGGVGNTIPKPPAFYAEPDYIGSHKFVGRARELEELTDWAKPADPTNLLLFEAIGGNGKSMLTWEWAIWHAMKGRTREHAWAGRFWYSFYERGALMSDFCQRALSYMTGQPLEEFAKKRTAILATDLLAQLHARPWLLVLDGLERVLVAYHRIDASEVPDEEANAPTDKIANRNPCDAIRDEDNDLLRALAAAAPSKLLVTSRLTPRVLLNPSGQPIAGAKRIALSGLRPPDAEALLRSCGIEGGSATIQSYLAANCDNHPLVIGVLSGLIANFPPARGNFDIWSTSSAGGDMLDLASLDLTNRRNHILRAALDALPATSRQLLSTLALLADSVDHETLNAFNPHLPPEPEEVESPTPPEEGWGRILDGTYMPWEDMSDSQKVEAREHYQASLESWRHYENALHARMSSAEFLTAPRKLEATVRDLEQRGLLQWDVRERKYDLHPVVRGVASGVMSEADRELYGQPIVDYFNAKSRDPFEDVSTVEELRDVLVRIRTLLKLGRFSQAAKIYIGEVDKPGYCLASTLTRIEAYAETLSLLKPFFRMGWEKEPPDVSLLPKLMMMHHAGVAFQGFDESDSALSLYSLNFSTLFKAQGLDKSIDFMSRITSLLIIQNRLAAALRLNLLEAEGISLVGNSKSIKDNHLILFLIRAKLGQWDEAKKIWQHYCPKNQDWPSDLSSREAAFLALGYIRFHFWHGSLHDSRLQQAERLVTESRERSFIRAFFCLRGQWHLDQGEWALAAGSCHEAVRLARERGLTDIDAETILSLAKYYLGELSNPRGEAERLAQFRKPRYRYIALLWLGIGDVAQAKQHALAAYKWAWADGEPYVYRYELTKTTELLQQLNVPIPNFPHYESAKDKPFTWEAKVRSAIKKLRKQKEDEQTEVQ